MYVQFVLRFYTILFIKLIARVNTQVCKPQDCVVSAWSSWSDCSRTCGADGTRQRSRLVFIDAACGGKCPYTLSEKDSCNVQCCPVDCQYTSWTNWGLCYCTNEGCTGEGVRYNCRRSRVKTSNATCGGYCDDTSVEQACGHLCCYQDCVVGQWSTWSSCSASCEQKGTRFRVRPVVQPSQCEGKACGSVFEEDSCTGGCCPVHCVLGAWSEWGTCNTACGQGTHTRTRFVQPPSCGGTICPEDPVDTQNRTCSHYNNVNCTVSAWSVWSDCVLDNGYCGNGQRRRSRSTVTAPVCQGEPCGNLTETGACFGPCCRRDCQVTSWGAWSHCSSSCGQGVSNRTRAVLVSPECGGSLCPMLLDSTDCYVTHVTDCAFTDWSMWTACSTDCGVGVVTRLRVMTTPAYCGGACESAITREESACESYTAKQNCEVSPWTAWGECLRDCDKGRQARNRTLLVNPICGGTPCPDIMETRTCHAQCQQICNGGVCSCRQGYKMSADLVTCTEVTCPVPVLDYCPGTHRYLLDCIYPKFTCSQGVAFNRTCAPSCGLVDWKLAGEVTDIRCQQNGTWSKPLMYCVRPNKPPNGIAIDKTTLEENTPTDYCFAFLSAVTADDERYERHTFSIVSDPTDRFYIRDNKVCLKRHTDYEEAPNGWSVLFRCTDMEGLKAEKAFTFNILNKNEPPVSVKLEPNHIPENSAPGTVVGCLHGVDDDPTHKVNFLLVSSEMAFKLFPDGNRTCVKYDLEHSDPRCASEGGTHCALNLERNAVHNITVMASDGGTPPLSAYFDVHIYLTDANDMQTGVTVSPEEIPEEVTPGTQLLKMITIDEDVNQTYVYKLLDDMSGLFSLKGDILTANRTFDYETESSAVFTITVESTDISEPRFKVSSQITLKVGNVNEAPREMQVTALNGIHQFPNNQPIVFENAIGVLGTLSAMDIDMGDNLKLEIFADADVSAHIALGRQNCVTLMELDVYCTVPIQITKQFDFEKMQSFTLNASASDKSGLQVKRAFTVNVVDVNDVPTALTIGNKTTNAVNVTENSRDAVVGDLGVVDDDKQDTHVFELSQAPAGQFIIIGNKLKILSTARIDFELVNRYDVFVRITDNAVPEQMVVFPLVIYVVDVNEKPSTTSITNTVIEENSPEGTLVGELSTEDPDNVKDTKQTFTYTLPDDARGRFKIDGYKLLVKESAFICGTNACKLDYEQDRFLTVTVLTLDSGFPRQQRTDVFTILLLDVNDPPTNIKLDLDVIKENQPVGTVVGNLNAVDEDSVADLTFSLLDHVAVFEILDGNKLATKQPLDFEKLRSYRIRIKVVDTSTPPGVNEDVIRVYVLDEKEKPVFAVKYDSISIAENTAVSIPASIFEVSDPDRGAKLTAHLVDPSEMFIFSDLVCTTVALSGSTRCNFSILAVRELNAAVRSLYNVTMSITDESGLSSTTNMIIHITDVNQKPSDILIDDKNLDKLHIPENTKNLAVGSLKAVDKDAGQNYTFAIEHSSALVNGYFNVTKNVLWVTQVANLNYEARLENLTITLVVTDDGWPSSTYSKIFTIIVDDVNEPATSLSINATSVNENSPKGTVVASLSTVDEDMQQTHSYRTVGDETFITDGNKLLVRGILDFEAKSQYLLNVEVTDNGSPPSSAILSLTLLVNDLNEAPRTISISGNRIIRNSAAGTLIGTLSVDDKDTNQTHTFQMTHPNSVVNVSNHGQVTLLGDSIISIGDVINISVVASDDGIPPLSIQKNITLNVVGKDIIQLRITSENANRPFEENKIELDENVETGTKVAYVILSLNGNNRDMKLKVLHGAEVFGIANFLCNQVNTVTTCTCDIVSVGDINYERRPFIDLELETLLDGQRNGVITIRATVFDKNDPPTALRFSSDEINVRENSQDEFLGKFVCNDEDDVDTHVFTITGSSQFIVESGGVLKSTKDSKIDFETGSEFTINVLVADSANSTISKDFTINVIDQNELPAQLTISNNKVDEMSAYNTTIGKLTAVDVDVAKNHSFELLDGFDAFAIDGDLLKVRSNCSSTQGCKIDYETRNRYNLPIKVVDNGTPLLEKIFVLDVDVVDVNDPPKEIILSSYIAEENVKTGYQLASIVGIDVDAGQTLTFTTNSTDFKIVGNGLVTSVPLDYETRNLYQLFITAYDNGIPSKSLTQQISINITDVNEAPNSMKIAPTAESNIQFADDQPNVAENLPALTSIGRVIATDEDNEDTVDFVVLTNDVVIKNQQCIPTTKGVRCSGDLRAGVAYDFEEMSQISFELIATDSKGVQLRKNITLQIVDANDIPTALLLNNKNSSAVTVQENTRDQTLGVLSVTDRDKGQSYIFTIVEGYSAFYVSGNELRVTSAANLDFEEQYFYTIYVNVTDNGVPKQTFQKRFEIRISDVNEAPTGLHLNISEVPENTKPNHCIGEFMVTDPDNKLTKQQAFTFKLLDANVSQFYIESNLLKTGQSSLDFEKQHTYTVPVLVVDNGVPPLSSMFTVSVYVKDVNEPPEQLRFTGTAVKENTPVGTVIGKVFARDSDVGQTLLFSTNDASTLSVNGTDIIVNGNIDFESKAMISFTISATDNGSPPLSVSENYSLVVLDVNERPSAITLIDLPILLENTTIGSAVCRLNIADEDVNERLGLEITTGMDVFKIQGLNCSMSPLRSIRTGSMINGTLCTASILLNKKLDYETSKSPIVLRTKASDKGSLFATGEFKFTLMNSNEPPYDIILDTAVKEVPENTPNFVIGTFVTKDEDVGDKHKYQILTNWEFFTTVGNKLIVKAGLDYETKRSYNVTVRSTDSGEIPLSLTKTFTIEVKDLNEKPSNIVFTSSELQRDAVPGSIVNIVTVEDPDNLKRPGFQTHNCTLTPSDVLAIAQGEMTIKNTIRIANSLDPDETPRSVASHLDPNCLQRPLKFGSRTERVNVSSQVRSTIPKEASSLVVTITCTDTGVPSMYINQTLTKRIVDRVKPPKNLLFTSKNGGHDITVDENAPNIDLGQLSVINQLTKEVIDGVYTFALEEASKDYLSLTERTLRLTKPLDFETQSTKSFLVNVNGSDTFGDAFNITHIFTINVVDINEAPFGIDLRGKMSVKENSPEGAVVGTLFTHDSEDYQTYTYTILGVQYGIAANETDTVMINAFKIEGNMLKVGASRYLDYEQSPVVAVYMETVDSGEPPMTYRSVVLLRIDNDNDPPTDIRLSHNEVTENSKTGTFVGELIVNDEDIDQQQACEIVNVVDVPFRVVESTKLVVAGTIDYEMHNSLNMEVKCGDIILDGTHLHFTKTLAVLVLNVNEPPENISLSNAAIDEGNTVGQLIGEITATDLDSANLTFTIVQDNIGTPFQIKGTSTLIVNMVFDFETKASYNISITVTDEQGLFNTRRFEILVRDINEPPTAIHLDKNTISENTQTGALIGTFTTEDSDIGQKFVYTLDGQTQLNGLLEIRGSKLYVGSKQLDFETKPEISITVISMDNGIPSKFRAANFSIVVTDANDPPAEIIVHQFGTIPEDTAIQTAIVTLEIDDPDSGQKHSCFLKDGNNFLTVNIRLDGKVDLILTSELDFETLDNLKVSIVCTDGEFEIEKGISLIVKDVNESPSAVTLAGSHTVLASAKVGTGIGQLSATDPDLGQVHTFRISGPNADIVKINENNELQLAAPIPNFILTSFDPTLKFNIEVADNGNPVLTFNQTFTVTLTDVEIVKAGLPQLAFSKIDLFSNMTKGFEIGRLIREGVDMEDMVITITQNFEDLFTIRDSSMLLLANDIESINMTRGSVTVQILDTDSMESALHQIKVENHNMKCECKAGMVCVVNRNSAENVCRCEDDYDEVEGRCIQVNDCLNATCVNGGTCIDDIRSYICRCMKGYKGQSCDIKENATSSCVPNPCLHGICVPDNENYKCACSPGWTGKNCSDDIDDCIMATCYNGGTCQDRLETYVCECPTDWEGVHCHLVAGICKNRNCNTTHVCVAAAFERSQICVDEEKHLIQLSYDNTAGVPIETFQARLLDFILHHGRLPVLSNPNQRTRRQEQTIGEVQVFVVSAVEQGDRFVFEIVVLKNPSDVFTKDAVLTILAVTCRDINSRDLKEEVFCPSIMDAAFPAKQNTQESSSSIGVIVGVTVAFLVVVAAVIVAVVIWKKKANNVKPQAEDSGVDPNTDQNHSNGVTETHARDESRTILVKPVDGNQPTDHGGGRQSRSHALNMPADDLSAGSVSDHAKLVKKSPGKELTPVTIS